MSVSISEIIAGASVHAVPLAGECAGYLVLAAADQAVAAPRRIGPEAVRLFDDGTVRVEGANAAPEADAEGDLRALLDALLVRASSSTPALLRASRRAPGRGIAALVREIETALIPVNRAAAHRALARLERETERARHAGRLSSPPEITRREPEPKATKLAQPATPKATELAPPATELAPPATAAVLVVVPSPEPRSEPQASPSEEFFDDIPSLFAPPVASVETIAALAAEIETRPEPIVVRRSAPPPARTPSPPPFPVAGRSVSPPPFPVAGRSVSPPPFPVAGRSVSPPPFPVAEALPTTPVFGTIVQSYADDEMDIEVVFDDELLDDELRDDELRDEELTGVLVRSVPLEIEAMLVAMASPDTEPCPPALDDEFSEPAVSVAPPPVAVPDLESTSLLAEAAEMPPEAIPSDAIAAAVPSEPFEVEMPSEPFEVEMPSEPFEVEMPSEPFAIVAPSEPIAFVAPNEPIDVPSEPFAFAAPSEPIEALVDAIAAAAPSEPLEAEAPAEPVVTEALRMPVQTEALSLPVETEPPGEVLEAETFEPHGETLALALAIEPVVPDLPPAPRLAMPKPRPSDVDDLLDRMTKSNVEGSDDLRSSLKGLAGLEPTPPPPES